MVGVSVACIIIYMIEEKVLSSISPVNLFALYTLETAHISGLKSETNDLYSFLRQPMYEPTLPLELSLEQLLDGVLVIYLIR